jgi:hypothetical protein
MAGSLIEHVQNFIDNRANARAIPALPPSSLTSSGSISQCRRELLPKMARQRIRRGVVRSITDLQAAIKAYLAERNASPNLSSGPNRPRPFSPNSNAALYHPLDSVH